MREDALWIGVMVQRKGHLAVNWMIPSFSIMRRGEKLFLHFPWTK